jgi:transmembrane sensor
MQHLTIEKQQELSAKWLKGTITAEELELLERWYNQEPQGNILWEAGDADKEQLGDRLFYNINQVQKADAPVHRLNRTILYKVAAMLVAVLGGAWYYTTIVTTPKQNGIAKSDTKLLGQRVANANKAILTLANGSTMVLDNTDDGLIAKQGNTRVNKTHDGELIYNNEGTNEDTKVEFNMISTSSGGQYQISLPDGSKVWLNALTSLKFPTVFKGTERVVELTGEAYFEVAKNKSMPFKVKLAGNTSIEVLGTHFNIMAYANEGSIQATLLEGSINVQKNGLTKIMIPGQEASITDEIKLQRVDADEAISWKNGLFSFDKSNIHTVMRQIERWYNVEVVYENKVPNYQITGYISRSSNLSEVIKILELSGLRIVPEGRKLKIFND